MDILNPPKSYIDWRCAIHNWETDDHNTKEQFDKIKAAFYKEFPESRHEIVNFSNWLHEARHEMSLPTEQIEIRESDSKKHGTVRKMMIYDIQYWRERGQIRQRKIYMPLEPLYDPLMWGPEYSFYNEGKKKKQRK